jgi:hypothetical protein
LQTQNTSLEKNAFEVFKLKMQKIYFFKILRIFYDFIITTWFKTDKYILFIHKCHKNYSVYEKNSIKIEGKFTFANFKKIENSGLQHSSHYGLLANF